MLRYLACLRQSPVEALGDLASAIRVAWQEDERGVIAGFGAEVDLWHAR